MADQLTSFTIAEQAPGAGACLDAGRPVLHLLGGPYLSGRNGRQEVPDGSKRLLAFLALHGRRAERRCAAGALWPSVDDVRAARRHGCAGIILGKALLEGRLTVTQAIEEEGL